MKATELRINNLIQDKKGRICIVDGIEKDSTTEYEIDAWPKTGGRVTMPYKPIPLTEEWLLKFGFITGFSEDGSIRSLGWVKISTPGDVIYFDTQKIDGLFHLIFPYHSAPCFEVHQLQNLYFALTGEELKLEI